MALRKLIDRLRTPIDELDQEVLRDYFADLGTTPIDAVTPRVEVRVGGEIRSMRIVPRAGSPSLEVSISDGHGIAVAIFLGRRHIAGLTPGRRMIVSGIPAPQGRAFLFLNPRYDILR